MRVYQFGSTIKHNTDTRCFEHKLKNQQVKQCSLETRIIWFVNIPKILTKSKMMWLIMTENYYSATSFQFSYFFTCSSSSTFGRSDPIRLFSNFSLIASLFFLKLRFFLFFIALIYLGSLPNATSLNYYLYFFGRRRTFTFLFVSSFKRYFHKTGTHLYSFFHFLFLYTDH